MRVRDYLILFTSGANLASLILLIYIFALIWINGMAVIVEYNIYIRILETGMMLAALLLNILLIIRRAIGHRRSNA